MSPDERNRYDAEKKRKNDIAIHGQLKSAVTCPHCIEKGHVHMRAITKKEGISGGKATGAILTGGVSLLATGLSRKGSATIAQCTNCTVSWQI